jgi:hypothetical protein
MNTLSRFAEAVTLLVDAGIDPLAAANISELRNAIVAKCRNFTAEKDRAELVVVVNLIEDLEVMLDLLAAEHQAVTSISTVAV